MINSMKLTLNAEKSEALESADNFEKKCQRQ